MNLELTKNCALFFVIALCGCAAGLKGPNFQAITDISEDKALIYVYWPDEDLRTEFAIKANQVRITTLKNGGYFAYETEPGEIKLSANVNFKMFVTGALEAATAPSTDLNINVEPRLTYYVKCSGLAPKFLSLSMTHGQRLGMSLVPEGPGAAQIQYCKLLPPKG